jgi:hypothetical protein
MKSKDYPMSIRVNDEDLGIIAFLKEKLGLSATAVIRLALRRLRDSEKRLDKQ